MTEHNRTTKTKLKDFFSNLSNSKLIDKKTRKEYREQASAYLKAQENLLNSLSNEEEISLFKNVMRQLNDPDIKTNIYEELTKVQENIANSLTNLDDKYNPEFIEQLKVIVNLDGQLKGALYLLSGFAKTYLSEQNDVQYKAFEPGEIKKGFLRRMLFTSDSLDKQNLIKKTISHITFIKTLSGVTALEKDILYLNNVLNHRPPKDFPEKIKQIKHNIIEAATLFISHIRFDIVSGLNEKKSKSNKKPSRNK